MKSLMQDDWMIVGIHMEVVFAYFEVLFIT